MCHGMYALLILLVELNPWPQPLINIAGCTSADLAPLCIELHAKCFLEEWTIKDHRNVELKAVKQRCVLI